MEKQACVTLQRPPPLTFTFDNSFPVFSTRITFNCGFNRAAVTAQKNPAAPPPATTNVFRIQLNSRQEDGALYTKLNSRREDGAFCIKLNSCREDGAFCIKLNSCREDGAFCIKLNSCREDGAFYFK
jgi:hypothetical protein